MSLSDLVPVVLTTRVERMRLAPGEAQRNWHKRNRRRVVAYKRAWRAAKRKEGLCPT